MQQQQQQLYRKPNSGFARQIWEQAGLSEQSDADTIRVLLDLWVVWYAQMQYGADNNFKITWVAPNGQTITANYDAFYKWFLICSTITTKPQPQPQPQPQNLSSDAATV